MHNQATLNIVLLRVFFESQNKVLKASRTHRKDTMQSNGCGTYSLILFTSESEKDVLHERNPTKHSKENL